MSCCACVSVLVTSRTSSFSMNALIVNFIATRAKNLTSCGAPSLQRGGGKLE
jgi:hypothetical protein